MVYLTAYSYDVTDIERLQGYTKSESSCRLSGLASMIHNIYLWRTPFLRTLVMMRMRVGLHHVLNDPVGLIYTPVIFCWSIIILRQLYRDIVVLSTSPRKQDILAQCIVRKQDNDG